MIKNLPVCRYANPGGVWELTAEPWYESRQMIAAAIRRLRKLKLVKRQAPGRYRLIGVADWLVTTR